MNLLTITRQATESTAFPFSVPAIRALKSLDVGTAVTFFVGQNGSGKSTLLEGIAAAARLPTVGSADLQRDDTLDAQRRLGKALRLSWARRATRGFFLRAEDFFGFTRRLARERAELQQQMKDTEAEYRARDRSPHALGLALGPLQGSIAGMEQRYGADLDANSHGQSFLKLFQARFVPGGLHLLDEPEAPLSPQSQLALLALMAEMIAQNAQFIIATHSPILLAFPGARIYTFDTTPVAVAEYEGLDHVRLTRDFLNAPERYLQRIVSLPPVPRSGAERGKKRAPSQHRKGARE